MFEKDMRIVELIDIYGPLLSDRRRELIESYYFDDLSLSEIAINTGISRQGVRESIKKSESELESFEDKLQFKVRLNAYNSEIARLAEELEKASTALPSSESEKILAVSERLKALSL